LSALYSELDKKKEIKRKVQVFHFFGFTADLIGLSDEECLHHSDSLRNVLSRLQREDNIWSELNYFTRGRRRKEFNLQSLSFKFHPISLRFLKKRANAFGAQISLPFLRYFFSCRPDLVHFHLSTGRSKYLMGKWLVLHRIPYIIHIHGFSVKGDPAKNRFFQRASAVIAGAKMSIEKAVREYGIHPSRALVIPLGPDINSFKPLGKREETKRPSLLFVGRLYKEKGALDALKCLKKIKTRCPDANLKIVGPPQDREHVLSLHSYIEKEGLSGSVEFTDYIPNEKLPLLYSDADLFLFPSRSEGMALTVMEAMACGLPVAALRGTGGHSEIIKDNVTGLLAAPEDIAERTFELILDKDKLKRLSENSRREAVEKFSSELTYAKLKEAYFAVGGMKSPTFVGYKH